MLCRAMRVLRLKSSCLAGYVPMGSRPRDPKAVAAGVSSWPYASNSKVRSVARGSAESALPESVRERLNARSSIG